MRDRKGNLSDKCRASNVIPVDLGLMNNGGERKFPLQGYAGLIGIAIFWYVNWGMQGLRTHWAFFPLWLGYIFTVDAIAVWRGQPSMITSWKKSVSMFLISIPFWWLFEWMNARAGYWMYLPEDSFTPLAHALWSTLCFSTVVPALFVTTNLLLSFSWFKTHHFTLRAGASETGRWMYVITGFTLLIALFLWPQYGMAFMWISLFLILSPINYHIGRPSLMRFTAARDWRMVLVLFTASLICGLFWEMWNMYSWPKWIYTFPYLTQWKIFEMPVAGYLGYLPFSLEIWALTALVYPDILKVLITTLNERAPQTKV